MTNFRYVRFHIPTGRKWVASDYFPDIVSFLRAMDEWNQRGNGKWLFHWYAGAAEDGTILEVGTGADGISITLLPSEIDKIIYELIFARDVTADDDDPELDSVIDKIEQQRSAAQ